jgi:hypothetical protein
VCVCVRIGDGLRCENLCVRVCLMMTQRTELCAWSGSVPHPIRRMCIVRARGVVSRGM